LAAFTLSSKPSIAATNNYRPEIDGLRAIAVIAVIINHFNERLLPGGYLGVDIFFLISGFVITLSLSNRQNKSLGGFLSDFYSRRFRRLIPALVVFTVLTCLLISLVNPDPRIALKTASAGLLGFSNIYLYSNSTDYFGQAATINPFTHTWSLGVEEQFYLIFPFILWICGFSQNHANGRRNLAMVLGCLSLASLILFIFLYPLNQPAAYFLLPSRFWEMAAGSLLFLAVSGKRNLFQPLKRIPATASLLLMIAVMLWPSDAAALKTLLIILMTATFITSIQSQSTVYNLLTHRWAIAIGMISYSLYLWHWSVLALSRWTLGIHWWSWPVQTALMLALAAASFHFIENPFRKGLQISSSAQTIGGGLGILLSLSAFATVLGRISGPTIFIGDASKEAFSLNEIMRYRSKETGLSARECYASPRREPVNWSSTGLNQKLQSVFSRCFWQAPPANQTVAILGDSHSMAFFPMADGIATQLKRNLFLYSREGCPFPAQADTKDTNCEKTQQRVENFITEEATKQNRQIVLVLANYLNSYYTPKGANKERLVNNKTKTVEQNFQDYLMTTKNLARRLQANGGKVVLIAPLPQHPQFIPEICSTQWFRPAWSLIQGCNETSANAVMQSRRNVMQGLQTLKEAEPNIYIYDPLPLLCNSKACPIQGDGGRLYADDDHLSAQGVELLKNDFLSYLQSNNIVTD
jgi:peptidoglycan/LPS O-acetylase OafA/YrhL